MVLRNRTVSGSSTVLSMAPDGSRFMAGMTMYDTATLGSDGAAEQCQRAVHFHRRGQHPAERRRQRLHARRLTLYSAFNTAANSTPTPPPLASTLLINDPTNLGIRLGIRLPESIVAKMVMLSDGSEAWGLSDSGMIHLPLGTPVRISDPAAGNDHGLPGDGRLQSRRRQRHPARSTIWARAG